MTRTPLRWEVKLGIFLILASITVYTIKLAVMDDLEGTVNYIFNSLGFLPVNVLLVTIVLNSLLSVRARREKLEKLSVVIGTFFSEVGTMLLTRFSDNDPGIDAIKGDLVVTNDWDAAEFARVDAKLRTYHYTVEIHAIDLEKLRDFLKKKRDFLLRMLENPVMLEHEAFTEVLRATFHLAEELDRRTDLTQLPASDLDHLAGDINRVYGLLVHQWLEYMAYMKRNYPYLFSLAMRTNPFDETATPVVQQS
ncbi:MAG TPA: hypothetical protein ENN85_05080 [Methanoculleus sp.]|nr:hypothetical protein [Methanoculleus sp.]